MADAELHLKPRQLQAIGAFAAQWAFLETEMDFIIAGLGESIEQKQKLPNRFKDRIKWWRSLARRAYSKHPRVLKEIETIIEAIVDIHNTRALILHGRLYSYPSLRNRKILIQFHRHLDEWYISEGVTSATLIFEGVILCKQTAEQLIKFNEKHFPGKPSSLPRKYP